MAEKLLSDIQPGATILIDKAYDTPMQSVTSPNNADAGEHPRKDQSYKQTFSFSRRAYRQRYQVERFFNCIKQMRGLATRYDRRADNYLAALKLAATRVGSHQVNESAS